MLKKVAIAAIVTLSAGVIGIAVGTNMSPAERSLQDYGHHIGMTEDEIDKYAMFVCDKEYELADVLLYYMADRDETMDEEQVAILDRDMQAKAMMARCPTGLIQR